MRRIGGGGLPYEIKRDHQGLRIQADTPTAPSGELFERHQYEHQIDGGWGCIEREKHHEITHPNFFVTCNRDCQ